MYGFNKTHRLLIKKDFDLVFKHALRKTSAEFTVLFHSNNLENARLGLIIPKKVIRKAHDRNQIKRIIRESFRLNTCLPAVDVVVLAKPAANQASSRQLRVNLGKLWNALSM